MIRFALAIAIASTCVMPASAQAPISAAERGRAVEECKQELGTRPGMALPACVTRKMDAKRMAMGIKKTGKPCQYSSTGGMC